MKLGSRPIAAWIAGALLACAEPASAEPSIWARARDGQGEARRALIAEAQALVIKHRQAKHGHVPGLDPRDAQTLARASLARAAALFDQARAHTVPDPFVRQQAADVYETLGRYADAGAIYEGIVRGDAPDVLKAEVWASLAVIYAHLGRVPEEVDAYGRALALQALAPERARVLANRAEAYMLQGDITAAVEGYRAAIALMTAVDFIRRAGATALWGLGVALDRSGDLEGALDAVRVARSYDPRDLQINGTGWFYVPPHDKHWYEALGHWEAARVTDLDSVRVEAFARAQESWAAFIEAAPPTDRWVPVAKARLAQCKKERDAFLRRVGAAKPGAAPRSRYKPGKQ